jgi:hypothetical protein
MFSNFPVVTHETHRVKLDKIRDFDIDMQAASGPVEEKVEKPPASELFVALMSSINPFARFVIQELMEE